MDYCVKCKFRMDRSIWRIDRKGPFCSECAADIWQAKYERLHKKVYFKQTKPKSKKD